MTDKGKKRIETARRGVRSAYEELLRVKKHVEMFEKCGGICAAENLKDYLIQCIEELNYNKEILANRERKYM